MDVALHGGKDDGLVVGLLVAAAGRHMGLHHVEAHLHRFGGCHQLRQEERALVEAHAHFVERGDEQAVYQVERIVVGKQLFGCLLHGLSAPGDYEVLDGCGLCLRIGQRFGDGQHACRLGGGGCCGRCRWGAIGERSQKRIAICGAAGCLGDERQALRQLLLIHIKAGLRIVGVVVFVAVLDVANRAFVLPVDNAVAAHHVAVAGGVGVDDGQVQARAECGGKEVRAHKVALGQAEADVGNAERGAHAQVLFAQLDGVQDGRGFLLVGGHGHGKAVDDDVVRGNAVLGGFVHDLLRNGEALFCGGGYAAFVQAQADNAAAVLRRYGQHGIHVLLLAVYGVDQGLSAVQAAGALQGLGVGGIQYQRQGNARLQLLHRGNQHGRLVDLGQAHVHVQQVGAQVALGNRFAHQVIKVAFAQGRLQLGLAGGVDALADDAHLVGALVQHHGLLPAGDDAVVGNGALCRHAAAVHAFGNLGNHLGRGAAAAAHQGHAHLHDGIHGLGELFRGDVVDGLVALHARQARVGLDKHRHPAEGGKRLGEAQRLCRPQRAVHAHGVRAHGRKRCGGNLGRGAQEGAAVFLEGHGYEYGQVGVLFCRQQRSTCLGKVGKGFQQDDVAPCGNGSIHLLGEQVVCLFERKRAHGLHQLADGADVGNHVGRPGSADVFGRRLEHFGHCGAAFQLVAVRAEGVGGDGLGTCLNIGGMDGAHFCGVAQVQQVGHHSGAGKARSLQHGSHPAVVDQEFLPAQHCL